MYGHTLVAVYGMRADAERARDRLMQAGIPATNMRMSGSAAEPQQHHGFWDWLFGTDVPEHDRSWYETNLREGRTALSVLARDDAERNRIVEILEEFNPIELDRTAAASTGETGLAASAAATGRRTDLKGEEEQVIPVVKEELDIGKRANERRYHIRTYVVERPIEEAVTLRDERVIIEHRPVSDARVTGAADMPQQREFEVVERHEEPVVAKRAHTEEEIVVRKEANERTETVQGTVRETKVDVDKEGAERAGAMPKRNP